MTVISDRIESVGGAGLARHISFWVKVVREAADGSAVVATVPHRFELDDGEFTTTDLDPGPAVVRFGPEEFNIEIPVSSTPVRLWPLIDAGMPTPAPDEDGWIRAAGSARRIKELSQAEYATEVLDPNTIYLVFED